MCETNVEFPDMEILDHYAFQLLHLDYTTNSFFFVMTPYCPRENKRADGINKSALPLCSPTSLVGVKVGLSLWKLNLLNYLYLVKKKEIILESLIVWRHEEFAGYDLWQTGRI